MNCYSLAQQDGFLLEFGPDDVGKADGDHDYFDDDALNCNKRYKQANRVCLLAIKRRVQLCLSLCVCLSASLVVCAFLAAN